MNLVKAFLLGDEKNALKSSYFWNSLYGMINAGQSVIILMVIARTNNAYDAGVFSIGYATACLVLTIGNYGMRSFQATDIKGEYSFKDYLSSRFVTGGLMLVASVIYCIYGYYFLNYDTDKVLVIMAICLLKSIDAFEDVFHAMYQNKHRLDIAAKSAALRQLFTVVVLCFMLVLTSSLFISCCVAFGFSLLMWVFLVKTTNAYFIIDKFNFNTKIVFTLLKTSFAVFLSSFLSLYIVNASKYAIDTNLSQELQAYYTYLAMPVFVVGLLNSFLYQPILIQLANIWASKDIPRFKLKVLKQNIVVAIITLVTIIGAYFIGVPVLSILYNTDLTEYKEELLILLVGGGFLAMSGFITIVVTIMRRQNDLIFIYITVSIVALFLSDFMVKQFGISGAVWAYTLSVFVLVLLFVCLLMFRLNQAKRELKKEVKTY